MRKRLFDFSIALLGLILLSPLFLIVCLAIKAASSKPIFIKQKKSGKKFRPYYVYRFSVEGLVNSAAGASNGTGGSASQSVPAKMRLGASLNAFLALFNVLKGEMSLVGPKPEAPSFIERFKTEYETILRVPPGMADLSSIHSSEASTVLEQTEEIGFTRPVLPKKIKLAKAYVNNRSFSLDLKILFTTLMTSLLSLPSPFKGDAPDKPHTLKDVIFDFRSLIIFLSHVVAVIACNYVAFLLRFDGNIPPSSRNVLIWTLPIILPIRLGFLYLFGLNRGLWRYAGIRDMLNLGCAVIMSSVVIWVVVNLTPWSGYPRSIYFIDAMLLLVSLSVLRSSKKIYSILTQSGIGAKRVLIVGAGNAGEMIARDMKQDRRYGSQPVGFIDDDPQKRAKKIHNIPVVGNIQEIETAAEKVNPDEILIAIPSASPTQIKTIINRCKPLKYPIKTLPNIAAVLGGKVSVGDIRNLDIEDLIGRNEIRIDDSSVANKIRGKRVLITGAGGSIGSELCRQVADAQPKQLILVERHEHNLYQIELELLERAPSVSHKAVLADILDARTINQIFIENKPHIVFHAAAYKHVPMMEKNPIEAVRNNILGTYQIITASDQYGVDEFVLISTDKAVSPTSVMGASKRVAEMLVRYFDCKSQTKLVSVRFGNVLESSGSVVPLFREQIKKRRPVSVTHPEVKRYFISLQEAVQLVLEASVLGEGGEVFVLDMGEPIKIIDLARTMIILSGLTPEEEIPIQLIGLRPGEKLHEGLFEENEEVIQTRHEKIRLARNGKIDAALPSYIEKFAAMDNWTSSEEIKAVLKALIPTYQEGKSSLATPIPTQTSDAIVNRAI